MMMGFTIIVLAKQVPDTKNIKGNAMKEDGTVNRAALPAIFNPEDLHALEAALTVKDAMPGTKVWVVTMGPPAAAQILRDSLYRGADGVVLVSDRRFAGADTLATSYTLKCAIEKIGDYDLVFCGRQAIDGDTAQVGPQTAEKLGINQITCVTHIVKVDPEGRMITARRAIDGGSEVVRTGLPVLLTFTDEGYRPRPPSAKLLLTYKDAATAEELEYDESYLDEAGPEGASKAINLWDINAIGANPEGCGFAGSPTWVKNIESAVLTSANLTIVENTEVAMIGMIRELVADHTLN
jgi:electron transfer flavoprotein beta subunit